MERPYLSIVMTSRNDNHGGDLNRRTQSCIDRLSEQILKFNISAEIVIVDWNPPENKPLLHEVIKGKFRSIIVPKEIHNRYGQAKLFPLYQMIAKNAGIRRANGEFILATNVDILFSDELMRSLSMRELVQGYLYRAIRYDVKSGANSLEEAKNNVIRINQGTMVYIFVDACGDFQLMHRDDWFNLRGYYEGDLFSIHIDALHEYHSVFNGYKERIFQPPHVIYHVEHDSGMMAAVEKRDENNRVNDRNIKKLSIDDLNYYGEIMKSHKGCYQYNNDNWGLANDNLKEIS